VPVPDEPFPNVNDSAMFRSLFGLDEPEAEPGDIEDVQARFRAALPE
jgi:hypothetical protein